MIESIHLDAITKYGYNSGMAVCLGAQVPTYSTGHRTCKELFKALGYYEYHDIDYNGQAEFKHDLNYPLPLDIRNKLANCQLLFDGGVLEHVANIGQALETIISLSPFVAVLANPVYCTMGSFYNLSLPLLERFYCANGYKVLYKTLYIRRNLRHLAFRIAMRFAPRITQSIGNSMKGGELSQFIFDDNPKHIKRFSDNQNRLFLPNGTHLLLVVQRINHVCSIHWPDQIEYER